MQWHRQRAPSWIWSSMSLLQTLQAGGSNHWVQSSRWPVDMPVVAFKLASVPTVRSRS
jgi:hypothetical protein